MFTAPRGSEYMQRTSGARELRVLTPRVWVAGPLLVGVTCAPRPQFSCSSSQSMLCHCSLFYACCVIALYMVTTHACCLLLVMAW